MEKIFYAFCPHCQSYSIVEKEKIDRDRMVCFECNKEFAFEKELLKTLDEIVEEGEDIEKDAS